jgi:hypothetical protein
MAAHETTFKLEEYPGLKLDVFIGRDSVSRVKEIVILQVGVQEAQVEEMLNCPAMQRALVNAMRLNYDWKMCNGCDTQVVYQPLLNRRVTFNNVCNKGK